MSRRAKLALGLGIAILISIAAVASYLIVTIDPNQYLPQVSAAVEARTGRRLKIDHIALSLFPRIELIAHNVSLSERAKEVEFAAAEKIAIDLEWLPLLNKRLVYGGITVKGLRADVVRYSDGTMNVDDLWALADGPAAGVDIEYLKIENGALTYAAEGKVRYVVSDLELKTGRISPPGATQIDSAFRLRDDAVSSDVKVSVKTLATVDAAQRRYIVSGIDLKADGLIAGAGNLALRASGAIELDPEKHEVRGSTLALELKRDLGNGALTIKVDTPALGFTNARLDAERIAVEASYSSGVHRSSTSLVLADVKGSPQSLQISAVTASAAAQLDRTSLQAELKSSVAVNFAATTVALSKLSGRVELNDSRLKKNTLTATVSGRGIIDVRAQNAILNFDVKVDRTAVRGDLTITGYQAPLYHVNASIDEIDLTSYIAESALPKNSTFPSFELSSLGDLKVVGRIDIGSLTWSDVRARNVRIELR